MMINSHDILTGYNRKNTNYNILTKYAS